MLRSTIATCIAIVVEGDESGGTFIAIYYFVVYLLVIKLLQIILKLFIKPLKISYSPHSQYPFRSFVKRKVEKRKLLTAWTFQLQLITQFFFNFWNSYFSKLFADCIEN